MFYIRSRCRWPNWPTRVCPWILACAAMMNLAAADSGSNIQKRKHWAFDPPVKTPPPRPQNADVGAHPVDCFLAVRRTAQQLPAAVEADRNTLIRRVTLDLTGLPPTLAEVATFTTNTAPEAYGRLITRLLNSPHYGEQMARFWLDLARYADTHGMHLDNERQMWAYRDWVVRSFNRNLSFDQFTIEQLAGDLLPHATTDQLTATGFNRCNVTSGEGGSIDAEYLFRYAVDRTSTTVQTWLGLTAGCAVCHDHKFDPISAKEFYSLLAFFGSAADPAMDGNILRTAPTVQLGTPETMRRLAEFDAQIKPAEAKLSTTYAGLSYTDPATLTPPPTAREDVRVWLDDEPVDGFKASSEPRWITAEAGPVFAGKRALRRQGSGVIQDVFDGAEARLTLPNRAVLFAEVFLDLANPPKTVMLQLNRDGWEHRALWGDPDTIPWGEKGQPSRALIGPLPQPGKWVHLEVSAEKIGLRPGDRIKGLVTSAAYRQASIVTPLLLQRDPENRFLARGPRFRLDAEQLRDQALFVAGLLDLTMGGKGVKPYQPPNLWEPIGFVGSNTREYKQDVGSALYRRSLYSFIKRTAPPPFMAAFDAPNREQSCTRRERSNTPLQALQLLNDVQYLEAARQLAGRMLEAGGAAASERLRFGFKTVLARDPDAAELQALESALAEHLSRYERDPAGAVRLISFGDSTPSATHPPAELAAYTLTANLLLNLDEALTRN